jgi:hypothetical protein
MLPHDMVREIFPCDPLTWICMGFGSYDESEQENQEYDADLDDDGVSTEESTHDGDVEFEFTASNDELLDRLEDIKQNT